MVFIHAALAFLFPTPFADINDFVYDYVRTAVPFITFKVVHSQKLYCRKMGPADFQTHVIPGLPDEIALLCLARVPGQYHNALTCVSRGWKALSTGWKASVDRPADGA
jgi:hypothetical protein